MLLHLFALFFVLLSALSATESRTFIPFEPGAFSHISDECRDMHHYGHIHHYLVKSGRLLVFPAFDSIGNFFMDLQRSLRVAMHLELALLVDTNGFPELNVMLAPNLFDYTISRPIRAFMGLRTTIKLPLGWRSAQIFLSTEDTNVTSWVPNQTDVPYISPQCLLTATFQKTLFAQEYLAKVKRSMRLPGTYSAWHIRTVNAQDRVYGYDPKIHSYILTDDDPDAICQVYHDGCANNTLECHRVFLATTSEKVKKYCPSKQSGLEFTWQETQAKDAAKVYDQKNLMNAVDTFVEVFLMTEASSILSTGSSLSQAAIQLRKFRCNWAAHIQSARLLVCIP